MTSMSIESATEFKVPSNFTLYDEYTLTCMIESISVIWPLSKQGTPGNTFLRARSQYIACILEKSRETNDKFGYNFKDILHWLQ